MAEFSKEIMAEREEQLEGLKNLFDKVFDEYYFKFRELPKLTDQQSVNVFVQGRPEIWRSITKLDLVLDQVTEVALEVLESKKKEIEQKGKEK
jgi:hypothetical protein